MKTKKRIVLILTVVTLFLLAGCKEITTTTIVHKDGSITRMIEVPGDSTIAENVAYPIPQKEGWKKVHHTKKVDGEDKKVWTMKKHYTDFFEMLDEIASIAAEPRRIRLSTDIAKIERWFYTYYRYREGIGSYNVFTVPVTDFVTAEELAMMAAKDSTLDEAAIKEIEAKYERWQANALLEVFYQALKTEAVAMEAATLTAADFEERKDIFFGDMYRAVEESDLDVDTFMRSAASSMQNPDILQLKEKMMPVWEDIEERIAFMHSVEEDSYIFKVEMPGLIIETNADGIEGNRGLWNVHHSQFLNEEYVLEITSRVPNIKALIVTGVLGLAAVIILVIPIFRRRKNR